MIRCVFIFRRIMQIVKAYDSPVQETEQYQVVCKMCGTKAYILSEDFETGDSFFCPNSKCGFWLFLPNDKNTKAEEAKQMRLKQLNENRKRKTKKYQKQIFQEQNQSNLFAENEALEIEQTQ